MELVNQNNTLEGLKVPLEDRAEGEEADIAMVDNNIKTESETRDTRGF